MVVRIAGVMLALVVLGARADASPSCPGDCDADGAVGIAELIAAIDQGLGRVSTAGCDEFDLDGDGAVEIHEILQLVRTALAGCLARLTGVYDVVGSGIALVLENSGSLTIDIRFNILQSLRLKTRPGSDGSITMEGLAVEQGDIALPAQGTGRAVRSEEGVEISGMVNIGEPITPGRIESFTLRRPRDGTPAVFNGTHRFALAHDSPNSFESHLDLPITVPPSGRATCAATDEVRNGTVIAHLPASECWVSPQGRLRYRAEYDDGDPRYRVPLQMEGALSEGPNAGSGTFWIALFPRVRGHGAWSAEKID
jgi:hypothetical protein